MANEPVGCIKGSVLQSRLAFVREHGGPAAVDRVLQALPDEDRKMLSGILLPAGWYPFATNERLDHAIATETKMGEALFLLLGEKSATDNLGSAQKIYVRDRDPHGLLKHAASIYRLYYDTGHRTYEKLAATSAVLRTFESRTFSRADCLTVAGWHRKAIEVCGGKGARVTETKCRTRGDEICEYLCEWS